MSYYSAAAERMPLDSPRRRAQHHSCTNEMPNGMSRNPIEIA
jgi:hypothetical protein